MKKHTNFLFATFFTVLISTLYSCSLHQNLSLSYKLYEGMSKNEVESIMGIPAKSDFYKNVEEWHYCKTGYSGADQFLALYFYDGKLIAKKNYSVTFSEAGAYGSCENFIKRGNYREPEVVVEIRSR